jgi:hypothetical protein
VSRTEMSTRIKSKHIDYKCHRHAPRGVTLRSGHLSEPDQTPPWYSVYSQRSCSIAATANMGTGGM